MKLSKGEILFLGAIILSSIFFFNTLGHTEVLLHKLPIEQDIGQHNSGEPDSASVANLTWDLYQLVGNEGITPNKWIVYWRGTLISQEEKSFRAWLQAEKFELEKQIEEVHQNYTITEQVWKMELNGTFHQVQIFNPHSLKGNANIIYTWSGNQMDQQWAKTFEDREEKVFSQFQQKPQTFTCIEGIVSDKLNFGLLKHNKFEKWITDIFEGEMTDQVSDSNFVSVNGYIPTWGKYFFSAGDRENNIQLSARYNALEDQTRVTIGYPLILKEH